MARERLRAALDVPPVVLAASLVPLRGRTVLGFAFGAGLLLGASPTLRSRALPLAKAVAAGLWAVGGTNACAALLRAVRRAES